MRDFWFYIAFKNKKSSFNMCILVFISLALVISKKLMEVIDGRFYYDKHMFKKHKVYKKGLLITQFNR